MLFVVDLTEVLSSWGITPLHATVANAQGLQSWSHDIHNSTQFRAASLLSAQLMPSNRAVASLLCRSWSPESQLSQDRSHPGTGTRTVQQRAPDHCPLALLAPHQCQACAHDTCRQHRDGMQQRAYPSQLRSLHSHSGHYRAAMCSKMESAHAHREVLLSQDWDDRWYNGHLYMVGPCLTLQYKGVLLLSLSSLVQLKPEHWKLLRCLLSSKYARETYTMLPSTFFFDTYLQQSHPVLPVLSLSRRNITTGHG